VGATRTRHRFHAICPYFAMFPEAFAERWINQLTRPGDLILDPFSGRGTTVFQANLMGRRGLACDINPVAFVLSKAKTNAPTLKGTLARVDELEEEFINLGLEAHEWESATDGSLEFFEMAYAPKTLQQLIFLRVNLRPAKSDEDCMICAVALGALHGETVRSNNYLSNQMPRTISTKPSYSVKYWRARNMRAPTRNVFSVLRDRLEFRYGSQPPSVKSSVFLADMRELPRVARSYRRKAHLVVTSPPYLDTTSFEEDQWLRLWLLGGPPKPARGRISPDDRRSGARAYWSFIGDMWRTIGLMTSDNGHVVIRVAGKDMSGDNLVAGLEGTSVLTQRPIRLINSESSPLVRRQTDALRPGSAGRQSEVDAYFQFVD